ncbi:MAG: AI-2E family transporter [Desulfococcaceae bacterium]|nr:AI-2E family transporter [Desulfococcaceae bacterium]
MIQKVNMTDIFRTWTRRYFSDPQLLMLGIFLILGFVLIFAVGDMLTPVFISVVIAYLLEGMVFKLEKFRMPRMAAVLAVFILFMAFLLVMIIWLIPILSRQIVQLIQDLPSMLAGGQKELLRLPDRYPEFISEEQIRQIMGYLTSELTRMGQYLVSISLTSVRGLIALLVYSILVPLMVFFFLKDKELIINWFKGLLPSERKLAGEVWQEVNLQIGNYVRGKIWEIFIVWSVTYASFMLLSLPFAMLLSFFVGLSVLIPYIGATVMFLPVGLIAFFEWGWGAQFAYVMTALAIIQALDGNLLVPLLLSGVVNIHPVAIIVAVLFFGGLWGFWGLFFAIPLATLFHAVIKAWLQSRSDSEEEEKTASAGG